MSVHVVFLLYFHMRVGGCAAKLFFWSFENVVCGLCLHLLANVRAKLRFSQCVCAVIIN